MSGQNAPFVGATRVPWLRPLAQALRLLALSVGALAAYAVSWTIRDVVVAVVLVGFIVWRALPATRTKLRTRDVLAAEIVLTAAAVAVTDGWSSPWLLAQLVPLGLAALGLTIRNAALVAVAAATVTTIGTIGAWPTTSELLLRASTLVMVVGFGVAARSVLVGVGGEQTGALGRLDELWSVRALLEGLHTQASGTRATFSIEEAVQTLRAASPPLAAADTLALLALEPDGMLRTLHAFGLPERGFRVRDLPGRAGQPRRDGVPVALRLDADGVGRYASVGAYLWLPVDAGEPEHVLVVEFEDERASIDDVLPEMTRFAQPLAITVTNAAWFARVRHLGVDEERQRIAARLHDKFAQSLAVVSLQLELASRRHPDDEGITELRGHVKETLGGLRDTMVELRASVDEDRDLPSVLAGLMTRLGERHGVVAQLAVTGDGPRPAPAIEQQLLRTAQELTRRAVEDRGAIAVYLVYDVTDELVVLSVADDGEAPEGPLQRPVTEVVRDRAEAIGATIDVDHAGVGLARVTITLHRSRPRNEP